MHAMSLDFKLIGIIICLKIMQPNRSLRMGIEIDVIQCYGSVSVALRSEVWGGTNSLSAWNKIAKIQNVLTYTIRSKRTHTTKSIELSLLI